MPTISTSTPSEQNGSAGGNQPGAFDVQPLVQEVAELKATIQTALEVATSQSP